MLLRINVIIAFITVILLKALSKCRQSDRRKKAADIRKPQRIKPVAFAKSITADHSPRREKKTAVITDLLRILRAHRLATSLPPRKTPYTVLFASSSSSRSQVASGTQQQDPLNFALNIDLHCYCDKEVLRNSSLSQSSGDICIISLQSLCDWDSLTKLMR